MGVTDLSTESWVFTVAAFQDELNIEREIASMEWTDLNDHKANWVFNVAAFQDELNSPKQD